MHPPPLPPADSEPAQTAPRTLTGAAGVTRRWPIGTKLAVIATLIVMLQVPLLLVRDTLDSRQALRREAVDEIARTWGAGQTVLGPVLCVPYTVTTRVPRQTTVGDRIIHSEELREAQGTAHFLPERLTLAGEIEVQERHRGIFRTPVYTATLRVEGRFQPDLATPPLEHATLNWARARVVVDLSHPHSLLNAPLWTQGGANTPFAPAAARSGGWGGIEAAISLDPATATAPFALVLQFQGSRRLAFAPTGGENTLILQGGWPHPGFDGAALPEWREIGPGSFSARWRTTHFGRTFPSVWTEQPGREGPRIGALREMAAGVTLTTPVDTYRMVERALKYALLVLTLVFGVYFLFEITSRVRVHPLQYLMVGGALVLFYLGFLALAEFTAVGLAYAAAAGVSTALIAGYSWSVLCAGTRSWLVATALATTYGCLYFLLQLEDYALLAGTAALFALLAAAMWLTRRLDWARVDDPAPARHEPEFRR